MADILTMNEYSRFTINELVDMIKALEKRIEELEIESSYDDGYKDGEKDRHQGDIDTGWFEI